MILSIVISSLPFLSVSLYEPFLLDYLPNAVIVLRSISSYFYFFCYCFKMFCLIEGTLGLVFEDD